MKKIAIFIIRIYHKYFSALHGNCCRFYPSCSYYAIESIERFGLIKGLAKGFVRVIKCNPLYPGGYDPVKNVKISQTNK